MEILCIALNQVSYRQRAEANPLLLPASVQSSSDTYTNGTLYGAGLPHCILHSQVTGQQHQQQQHGLRTQDPNPSPAGEAEGTVVGREKLLGSSSALSLALTCRCLPAVASDEPVLVWHASSPPCQVFACEEVRKETKANPNPKIQRHTMSVTSTGTGFGGVGGL